MISLVLPAAGSGTRFGSEIPKQFLDLLGKPVYRHALDAFSEYIDEIIMVCEEERHDLLAQELANYPKTVHFCIGGSTRLESVSRGIQATSEQSKKILVHDAARPCISKEAIQACLKTLDNHVACVLAEPAYSTVKQCISGSNEISKTLTRENIWLAQTPQCFRAQEGRAAFNMALQKKWSCTDDAQVLEIAGHAVHIVPAKNNNPKLTCPEDWPLAEIILQRNAEL